MRRHLVAAFALVPAAVFVTAQAGLFSSPGTAVAHDAAALHLAAKARPCDAHCAPDWMDANLRLDQIQVVGTAESYKQRPGKALMTLIRMGGKKEADALDFGLPSIQAQLDDDVRALAFDIAYDPRGGAYKNPAGAGMAMDLLPDEYVRAMSRPGFKVIHVLDVDYRSSCLSLRDCLSDVSAWSRAHPKHLPIVITLRTNDARTPMPGATRPVVCDEEAMNALETEIQSAFTADQLFIPRQLQGSHSSLREAALAHDWPKLGAVRGRIIFVLEDTDAKLRAYQKGHASLQDRLMFVAADEASPLAAFVSIADPLREGTRIRKAVKDGFIVLTRADDETREARLNIPERRDAAFDSGAQIVRTNFITADPAIGGYHVSLGQYPQAMCGAVGPEHCVRIIDAAPAIRTAAAIAP